MVSVMLRITIVIIVICCGHRDNVGNVTIAVVAVFSCYIIHCQYSLFKIVIFRFLSPVFSTDLPAASVTKGS